MKTRIIVCFSMVLATQVHSATITFDKFKQLSSKERDELLSNDNSFSHEQLIRWDWRLSIGENAWQRKEQLRLAERKRFDALLAFFIHSKSLREMYLNQGWKKEDTSLAITQRTDDTTRLEKTIEAGKHYEEAIPLLAALSPTPEARTLNLEASQISGEWIKRWPIGTGKQETVTPEEMAIINQKEREILNRLKMLPKLTPEQLQAASSALPEDRPHGVYLRETSASKQ